MIISHRLKWIFVRIPKTGSSSVESVLTVNGDVFGIDKHRCSEERPLCHHATLQEGLDYLMSLGYNPREYTVFTVVRRPDQRLKSVYRHLRRINNRRYRQYFSGGECTKVSEFKSYVLNRLPFLILIGWHWLRRDRIVMPQARYLEYSPDYAPSGLHVFRTEQMDQFEVWLQQRGWIDGKQQKIPCINRSSGSDLERPCYGSKWLSHVLYRQDFGLWESVEDAASNCRYTNYN